MIRMRILLRLAGIAALGGGLLRCISAFSPALGGQALEALWTLIDVLLTLGLIGIYLARAERLGLLGLTAFVIAIAALSFIGGPDANPFGFSTYQQGGTVLAIAMAAFAIAWLRAGERPVWAPLCWLGAPANRGRSWRDFTGARRLGLCRRRPDVRRRFRHRGLEPGHQKDMKRGALGPPRFM